MAFRRRLHDEVIGPQLVSSLNPNFHSYIRNAWLRARDLAQRFGGVVESLKPSHMYGDEASSVGYVLKVGDIYLSNALPEKSYIVIYGVFNNDENFDYVKFQDGSRVTEWFVKPVYYFTEKIGVWGADPVILSSSGVITIHSQDSGRDRVNAWILAYVVMPRMVSEVGAREERRRRRGRS
ncbi:MAG: hypothetical protein B6V02_02270 [Thermoprotei archaeon ex4572_64]|nr:MAG: hypothetical protein B6V02_02270 [Thermoprotei archaeon ex4572_64]